MIRRFEKGLAKSVDVKRFVTGLEASSPRAAAFLEEAQVMGDFVPLLVDVSIMGDGGVKIAEVIEALFPHTGGSRRGVMTAFENSPENIPYHAVRAELGLSHDGGYVTPLDLAKVFELRPPPPPEAPHRRRRRHRDGADLSRTPESLGSAAVATTMRSRPLRFAS